MSPGERRRIHAAVADALADDDGDPSAVVWHRVGAASGPDEKLADALDVNARLSPDVVVLDEAQRIKNWSTKTAQAVKRLRSRYAFVLTGTPIENRIDEMYSLMDFLEPRALGPLFRFNRDFYQFDERGRPAGYRDLATRNILVMPNTCKHDAARVTLKISDFGLSRVKNKANKDGDIYYRPPRDRGLRE